LFVHERSFDVELGKFGLTIGTQVFVAKAARDLKIALKPRHH